MAALREILIAFGMTVDASPLDKAQGKVDGFLSKIKQAGEALAGAFAVKKLWDFEQGMVSLGDQLGDSAARLGVSTQALEQWKYAANFAEISGEELQGMFEKVSRAAFAAGDASSEQGKALKKLGVDVKDTSGNFKNADTVFEEIGLKLAGMKEGVDRTSLAIQFFGRGAGPKIIQLFKDGKPGLEAYRKEFEELGGGFGDFAEKAGEVDDQQKRLDFAWTNLKVKIAGVLLPAFRFVVVETTRMTGAFMKLIEGTHAIQSALIVLGALAGAKAAMILIQYAPIIGTFLLWAAAIAFVVLALDDVWGFFTGKNSLIGKAIDELFGKGASEKVRAWAISVWDLVSGVGQRIIEIFTNSSTSVFEKFQELIAYFEGVFRTKAQEIFGSIGGDVVAEMASAITEVIGLFVSAADQVRKVFQGIFKFIGEGIASGQDAQLNDQARAQRKEDDRIAGLPPNPISGAEVRGLFGQGGDTQRAGGFFGGDGTVPVRAPGASTNTTNTTNAPNVNVNVSVAPGTPQAQQQALAAAAAKGTTSALGAPNRAATASLERRGV